MGAAGDELELLLFDVAGRPFGAAVTAVRRIDRHHPGAPVALALGRPARGGRALVVGRDAAEVQVPIDAIIGVRRVPRARLRRLPAFAEGLVAPGVVGVLLDGDRPVPLIALEALVHEDHVAPAPTGGGASRRGG